ncbi:MAG: hypothetical protein FWB97_05025, partial [Oscillospiraceae bacterium]|nr:hypothetical protein [Oscillospiraceae bacterium]
MLYEKSFVNPLDSPYGRRGSYIAFANRTNGWDMYGKCTLWLASTRDSLSLYQGADINAPNGFRQIRLELMHGGRCVPTHIHTTTEEVVLKSRYGEIRFVIAERKLALGRSTEGLSLLITKKIPGGLFGPVVPDEPLTKMTDGSGGYVMLFRRLSKLLIVPITGALTETDGELIMSPDEKGVMEVAFEDWVAEQTIKPRPASDYPSYEKGVQSVKDDFGSFCESVCPSLPAAYEPMRIQSLWQTWSMMVDPDGESAYRHTMVKMVHSIFEAAFVWQMPMQAIWLSRDMKLAWEVFKSGFDHQEENGRLVDALGFFVGPPGGAALKPPVHGLSLLWLMENCDLSFVPKAEKEAVWEGLRRWTEYFLEKHDTDGDGVVEFLSIIETGWEDAPCYNVGFPCASPELNAFIALNMEALGKFGREIGKPEDVCAEWEAKSKALISKIPGKFWDGTKWFAFNAQTGKRSDSATLALFCVLVLGDRLPKDVVDKSIEFMYGPDGFDTEFSLATEGLTSDYFTHGFTAGSVMT